MFNFSYIHHESSVLLNSDRETDTLTSGYSL